ncbi:zinc metalloprotease HtpX [bacterium CG06_land_8_20_14_3_00_33_50]|nr:MAG: zinc metalloprotease HtpX [bacterium CG2_30_33_46]PIR67677.1 MAG: zinc metalloprotease HtpX [bacterium CG10_big_fil_rev_8_21_14_0_10_33_18]PIU76401.1 MAG: zinc metalloprotease HtpX [bacterium CG06_land_8_20_14_3_00_33_50]PIW81048.1 MAG: zinc metalloprotease HtpX [bacterium CG_4_8_14_3_um_filter_33_28]PIY85788.1 MAG: zinc metalloprotease HtpX [bacterium CG_4_10_14_0_8_um_filter_33_57]PJA72503.1 MAG: zinc metalloprotease HtpX [bacterium CG_4_9_14_3_um_filter_33_26]
MTTYTQIDSNKRRSFALLATFLVFIILIGWIFSRIFDSPAILIVAVFYSIVQALVGYYAGDKITLAMSGAKKINKEDNPTLYNIVENLTISVGLPMPNIYIIDDTAPNAFATGRDPHHASIAVTTGIMQKLQKNEIEGVIAHELSHIKNYDIRILTLTVILVGLISLLSDWFLRFTFWGRGDRNEGGGQWQLILLILGIILAILSPIIATLIKLAISRKREFLADADGALMTRYPDGLASALEKISADTEPLEVANKATAHLYIANPLKEHQGKDARGWFANMFETHPPIEERISKLRQMAA